MAPRDTWLSEGGEDDCCSCREILEDLGLVDDGWGGRACWRSCGSNPWRWLTGWDQGGGGARPKRPRPTKKDDDLAMSRTASVRGMSVPLVTPMGEVSHATTAPLGQWGVPQQQHLQRPLAVITGAGMRGKPGALGLPHTGGWHAEQGLTLSPGGVAWQVGDDSVPWTQAGPFDGPPSQGPLALAQEGPVSVIPMLPPVAAPGWRPRPVPESARTVLASGRRAAPGPHVPHGSLGAQLHAHGSPARRGLRGPSDARAPSDYAADVSGTETRTWHSEASHAAPPRPPPAREHGASAGTPTSRGQHRRGTGWASPWASNDSAVSAAITPPGVQPGRPMRRTQDGGAGAAAVDASAPMESEAFAPRLAWEGSHAAPAGRGPWPVPTVDIREIHLGRVLGEGGFGKVYFAHWRGQEVAVKVASWGPSAAPLPGQRLDNAVQAQVAREFSRELSLMRDVPPHPNLLRPLAACVEPPALALVMEICARGSLFSLIHSSTTFLSWKRILGMLVGAARAVEHLHAHGVVHRDLKSANFLVSSDWSCKIADFGLSRVAVVGQTMTGGIGTFQWAAPEVLSHQRYSEKADVYSFGIVAWECCARKLPYEGLSGMQAALAVVGRGLRPKMPSHTPGALAALIQDCWAALAKQRPTMTEVRARLEAMALAAESGG